MYGEDAELALRFLFNAMAPKARADFPFQGRPKMLYLDNGPVAKSHVFQNVMQSLKVDWLTHTPAGKDSTRTTARSKRLQVVPDVEVNPDHTARPRDRIMGSFCQYDVLLSMP